MPATPQARTVRPAPNRRVARRFWTAVLTAILLIVYPGTASAQLIDFLDWLDRLSGPGPFTLAPKWIPSVSVPIGCITEVTYFRDDALQEIRNILENKNERAIPQEQQAAINKLPIQKRVKLSGLPGCLGIKGLLGEKIDSGQPLAQSSPPWGVVDTPAGPRLVTRKKLLVAFEANVAQLASVDNDLPYRASVTDDEKQVNLLIYGAAARVLIKEVVFLQAGWSAHRFSSSSGLFEAFHRHTRTAELGLKPLVKTKFNELLKPFVFSVGVSDGLGHFTARQFGSRGDWEETEKANWYVQIGYDIWWHGCWLNRC